MKALILGLPGSGTSCFAEVLSRAGYSDGPPTFAKGNWPYPTHESLLGRSVNRIILGATGPWPTWRWHHDYRPRNPYNDPEVHALARWFVDYMDSRFEFWYFKNPESLLAFDTLWNRIPWDKVIGIFRHPEESIQSLHAEQKACYRRVVWNRYGRKMADWADVTLRFPDDVAGFSEECGVDSPLVPHITRRSVLYDPDSQDWCRDTWARLQEVRWTPTPTSTTANAT